MITYHIECPLYSQDKGGRVGNGKGTRAQILLKEMQEDVLSTLTGDISVFMWRGGSKRNKAVSKLDESAGKILI